MSDTINYGIDLGTTNSSIAKCEGGEVRVFKNLDQMDVTPSVVRIEKSGRIIVGRRAYANLFSDPDNVAADFKRWMGQSDRKSLKAAGKSLSAEELSAEVLKSLIEDARRQTTDLVTASIITVPAAFGQLQCEATARAATLAGLNEAPLLQEPLAASIAYGMKPDARDKRWLVYDLGGGTFDIVVISTRNGQLSILEHRGDNMLGGKDFDRLIVEKIIWPRLEELFNMPEPDIASSTRKKLIQRLRGEAEQAKIDLSLSERVIVSISDVGEDEEGNPIEAEFEITRDELNHLVEPYIAKTIDLCKQAMGEGRVTTNDLSSIILVGGPTYMPLVREMLKASFSTPLNFTIDPMTVVARGAAIYASTLSLKQSIPKAAKTDAINITLAHETVWPETACLVVGRIDNLSRNTDSIQILIDAESGHWNSGWIPIKEGCFEAKVHLLEGKTNRFWIYLRDDKGNDLTPNPDSFSIRHGLTLAEPPLPHSIGAEVVKSDGKTEIDIIFPRSTRLPAQKILTYKANKTLRPSQSDNYVAIKLWEGEYPDPESNTPVGALKINASDIHRPIPEGADIELTIAINASRCMDVQAFVPVLNQHFQERVYIAKENEIKFLEKISSIDDEIEAHFESINTLNELAREIGDDKTQEQLRDLQSKTEELCEEHDKLERQNSNDPDDAKRVVQQSKELRGKLSQIEKNMSSQSRLPILLQNIENERLITEDVVKKWGERQDQREFEMLCRETDRHVERKDEKSLSKTIQDFQSLKWRILFKQDWYWKEVFDYLCKPGIPFINDKEAKRLITEGREAVTHGNGDKLKEVVRGLWELQPKSTVEAEKEKALEAGIRRKFG